MILTIGKEADLLHTRAEVLRKTDHEVLSLFPQDVDDTLRKHKANLLVLCHTLDEEETASVVSLAHNAQPDMKILYLKAFGKPLPPHVAEDSISNTEPEKLVHRVKSLLSSCGNPASH